MIAFTLAAIQSNSGKTTVAMGLMRAFRRRGYQVQPYKAGPDYIDPMYHSVAAGRKSRNLDLFMLGETTAAYLFRKNQAEVNIVEGVMGLYDGNDRHSLQGSTAHLSQILNLPVILVVQGQGMSLSLAALVKGFQAFSPSTKIAGVLLNQVKNASVYQYLKGIIEDNCQIPVVGYLSYNPDFALNSRHLGLYCSGEITDLENKLDQIAADLEQHLDWETLAKITDYQPQEVKPPSLPAPLKTKVRIGYAFDAAFNFYYQDSLDLLEELGAELVPFSPLADSFLPEVDGVILGGGYPELYLQELSVNQSFKASLKAALEQGMPGLAECGGLIYLGNYLDNPAYPLVGYFPFSFTMTDKLQRFGYLTAQIAPGTILSGDRPEIIRGHEFHYTKMVNSPELPTAYTISKASRVQTWAEGFVKNKVIGGYPHFNFYANPSCAAYFLRQASLYQSFLG